MPKAKKAVVGTGRLACRRYSSVSRVQLKDDAPDGALVAQAYAKSTGHLCNRRKEIAQMPCLLFDPALFSASEMSRRIKMVNVIASAVLHMFIAAVLMLLSGSPEDQPLMVYLNLALPWFCIIIVVRNPTDAAIKVHRNHSKERGLSGRLLRSVNADYTKFDPSQLYPDYVYNRDRPSF